MKPRGLGRRPVVEVRQPASQPLGDRVDLAGILQEIAGVLSDGFEHGLARPGGLVRGRDEVEQAGVN